MSSDVRIVLVVAFTGVGNLAAEASRPIQELLSRENNVDDREIFTFEEFNHSRIYSFISGSASQARISMQIGLSEWGKVDQPFAAYYGQMKLSEIAEWAKHGKSLMDRNIRFYHGSTEVNDGLEGTIVKNPQSFWYFNNGITVICSKIKKTRLNGDSRDYGVFECEGVCVVNGAQTVGVICDIAKRDPAYMGKLQANVNVRLISLEDCPAGFDRDVARATNTQNQVKSRDFAALDPTQARLAQEMLLDRKRYAYKSGDEDPRGEEGCGIEEATVALACSLPDVGLAVQAKREVSRLWVDITKPPYTLIFNDKLQAIQMWRAVKILRVVTEELSKIDVRTHPRGELVAVHGNRMILHRVFRNETVSQFRDPNRPERSIYEATSRAAQTVFHELAALVEQHYDGSYLANLFKNAQKCDDLSRKMVAKPTSSAQIIASGLFEHIKT